MRDSGRLVQIPNRRTKSCIGRKFNRPNKTDKSLKSQAVALQDNAESASLHRFLSARARRESALCRSALRIILSELLGCAARQFSFDQPQHGKHAAKVEGETVKQGCNVSRNVRRGLIAVAEHAKLSIDVEQIVALRDFEGIGSMNFSSAEQAWLKAAAGPDKVHLFYRLWCLKEALI